MSASPKFSIEAGNRLAKGLRSFSALGRSALSNLLLLLVGAYRTIGTNHLGGSCRFEPSCSEYAVEALHLHPPLTAVRLISVRIAKCRPGQAWGFDAVPQPQSNPAPGTGRIFLNTRGVS
jgi:putative membrane protein insertion efficiency factor